MSVLGFSPFILQPFEAPELDRRATFRLFKTCLSAGIAISSFAGIWFPAIHIQPAIYHSLFVNCGGPQIKSGGNEYVQDLVTEGASYFYSTDRWAYSSTGVFISNDKSNFVARKANVTGDEYYQTARLSPSSLKYYGLCLQKGSYKVRLHFAEIQFSNDETYGSIGRRIFDVSIQGNIVWKDFNIAEKAGGIGKGITLEKDVTVNSSTLEIHLHWSGKGTTAVPDRGVYGPLISAISVTPNFVIKKREVRGLSIPMIAGIIVASIVSLALMLYIFWMKGFLGGKYVEDKELRGAIEQKTGYFSLRQIKAATETVSGRSNTDYILEEEFVSLLDRAYVLQEQGNLLEIVDPILGTNYSKQEATSVINIALLCTSPSPSLRPCMSAVVSMLQGKKKVEAPVVASNTTCDYTEFKGFENITLDSQTRSSMFSGKSLGARSVSSMDWPWDDSSVSMPSKDTSRLVTDLYDVILD
ncbi:hypothetical protein ACET3Z_016253 [Daucus carota]